MVNRYALYEVPDGTADVVLASDYDTTVADYEEVLADKRRLTHEIDVLLNGKHAATQASLCDIVGQLQSMSRRGELSPSGFAMITLLNADYRRKVIKAIEALIPQHDHLDGSEYCINECIKAVRSVELTES
jgi:hypothetical protein